MEKLKQLLEWLEQQEDKSLKFYAESLKRNDSELAKQFTGENVAFALTIDRVKELMSAGVVENFAQTPTNETQSEALNKHDVSGLFSLAIVKKAFEVFQYRGFPHNEPTWEEWAKENCR